MQDNIITLPVDPANNGTIVEETYRRFTESENKALYIAPDHSDRSRNTMTLLRTLPKPNGTFNGVGKASVKFTEDTVVPTTNPDVDVTAPGIIEVNLNLPVGASAAFAKKLRMRAAAFLMEDDVAGPLHELREV